MGYAIGVDGCKAGWFAADIDESGCIHPSLFPSVEALINANPKAESVLIDIPIGLIEKGNKGRWCDEVARKLLGPPKASSVFTPPCRPATRVAEYEQASKLNYSLTGKLLSSPAWGIVPKIAEVDSLLEQCPDLRQLLIEVHPELLFWALNGGKPMMHPKKKKEGRQERMAILMDLAPGISDAYKEALKGWPRKEVGKDDIIDAFAAAVTGSLGAGRLDSIPGEPEFDARGIPMRMVYWRPQSSKGKSTGGRFQLRPGIDELVQYVELYDDASDDRVRHLFESNMPQTYLNMPELLNIVSWKSPRPLPRVRENTQDYVRTVTEASLRTSNEQFRIEALQLLRGIGWPVASVILHLCLKEDYPILDYRALWTLGIDEVSQYNFDLWWDYVETFRELMVETGLSARDLDRALWQYSKENQS